MGAIEAGAERKYDYSKWNYFMSEQRTFIMTELPIISNHKREAQRRDRMYVV